MNIYTVCLTIFGVIVLVALVLKGDVKASFKLLGAMFSLETTQKK